MDAGDDRGQRKVQGRGELRERGGLADAGLAPQEYGQIGGHGEGQGLQLDVGAGFGGGVAQQGRQFTGDVELGGAVLAGVRAGRGERGACEHV
ncbi:hypothetical protein GCM10009647_041900 [Streptomyces sanglieri]